MDRESPQFGVYRHGRRDAKLTQHLAEHVATWDRDRRNRPRPDFTLYPADATVPTPTAGRIFTKRHTQLVMSWPD